MTLPPNPSRNSYWLPIVSTSIWIALTAMIWSAVLYDVGNRRDSVLIVVCISLITILILFIIAWRTVAASLRQFNPRDIVYADYGSSERGFHYWTDAGGTGETLADYLRELFERPTPERLTNELLRVHDPATTGPHKILRFKLSDGRCFLLYEYGVIRIDTAIRMPPFEPFVKNTAPSSLSTTYQPDEVEYADYGIGNERVDVMAAGGKLYIQVKYLLRVVSPVKLNWEALKLSHEPARGRIKALRIRFRDGRCLVISDGESVSFSSATPCDPFFPPEKRI